MIRSTIVWRLIFVNNYPTVQAPRQLSLRSCLETNRFKIGLFRRLKRQHDTIFPLHVEDGNKVFEFRKHFLPRRASEILVGVKPNISEEKYMNFEVTEKNWVLSHMFRADILSGCNI
jgi:hypothetical protein